MSADLLKRLADAGTPMDLVMEVACALADALAAQKILEKRRAKDRERKAVPRNSTETEESAEFQPKGFPEVSPPAPPLPNPSQTAPLSPPKPRGKKAVSILVPDWMPTEHWLAFVAMRERMERDTKGKVLWSEDAAKGVVNKITRLRAEGHCPAKLLEKAVVSSHRTVFEDESTKASAGRASNLKTPAELRELAEWYVRRGMQDNAEECRRKAIALESRQAA